MKRICIVTATRAEYGLLRWTIEALRAEPCLDAQLVVTGTHLSPAFGETWRQIEADGVRIDRKIDYLSEDRSPAGIAREMGVCATRFAKAFSEMKPDLLLVLGDRYELLPICSTVARHPDRPHRRRGAYGRRPRRTGAQRRHDDG